MTQSSKQGQELGREEREEVFWRSLKATGLSEDGPMTPQQRELAQRTYANIVLGEPSNPTSNTRSK
jgi:hypothetical protein